MPTAFWIVTRDYVAEAAASASSVARTMPEMRRCLFSPDEVRCEAFHEIHQLTARTSDRWYVDCSRYVVEALEAIKDSNLLYLDSDTYFLSPASELFDLLENWDLAAAHAPGRSTAPTVSKIPDCFPEFNIGVIVMNNSPIVRSLWQKTYSNLLSRPDVYGNNDQAPFREALWHDRSIRVTTLPPEYNCRFIFGTFVTGKVKVLHGRGNYEIVGKSLNAQCGMRTWQP